MKQLPSLPPLKVPFWMNGESPHQPEKREPYYLTRGMTRFWQRVWQWLSWPLQQLDPLTCSESLLNLLAWERDITRFQREPMTRYRRRVKYAFANARDAGEAAGFMRIFQRLEAPVIRQQERVPGIDWDVVLLDLKPTSTTEDALLMGEVIRQYGRTCRRYEFVISQTSPIQVCGGEFNSDTQTLHAHAHLHLEDTNSAGAIADIQEFNLDQLTLRAWAHITLEDTDNAGLQAGTTEFNLDHITVTAHGSNH